MGLNDRLVQLWIWDIFLSKSLSLSCWKLWHLLFFREAIQPGRGKTSLPGSMLPPSGAAPQWKAAITTQGFEVPRCSPTFELNAKEQMKQSSREIAFPCLNWRPKRTLSAWTCRATPAPGETWCFHSLEGSVFCNKSWQTEGLFSRLALSLLFSQLKGAAHNLFRFSFGNCPLMALGEGPCPVLGGRITVADPERTRDFGALWMA